jgi:GTP1/Obg family GTP-binding protein
LASTKEEQEAMTKTKEEMRNLAEATNISLIEEISTIINESIAEINKITPPTSESTDFLGVLNQATEDLGEINNSMGGAGETAAASGKLKIYKKSKFSKRIKRSWL